MSTEFKMDLACHVLGMYLACTAMYLRQLSSNHTQWHRPL